MEDGEEMTSGAMDMNQLYPFLFLFLCLRFKFLFPWSFLLLECLSGSMKGSNERRSRDGMKRPRR